MLPMSFVFVGLFHVNVPIGKDTINLRAVNLIFRQLPFFRQTYPCNTVCLLDKISVSTYPGNLLLYKGGFPCLSKDDRLSLWLAAWAPWGDFTRGILEAFR